MRLALVTATANPHKVEEISAILGDAVELLPRPDEVGDVVEVPLLLPHSLQHGVRTIEFQTPVYERKILSFAQKVLTQDHWDTASAIEQMDLLPPEQGPSDLLESREGLTIERIVDFDDFEVRRITLSSERVLSLHCVDSYELLMVVSGEVVCEGHCYGPESALILPMLFNGELSVGHGPESAVFLLAAPVTRRKFHVQNQLKKPWVGC